MTFATGRGLRLNLAGLLAAGCSLGALPPQEQPPAGRLRVESFKGDTAARVSARFYLTDAAGAPHDPPRAIVYDKGPEHHFVTNDGGFELSLPAGRYRLVTERGPEYLPDARELEIEEGRERRETVRLERWIDMNQRGWYSGDLHNHRPLDHVPALLLAEDLNLAPTITDWIWEERSVATPPDTSDPIRLVDARHVYSVLDKEVERLEAGPGAVALLGLRSVVPFEGYRLHPPDAVYARRAREQGGYVDAEKIVWRDGAALAALGLIDFVGIVHNHFNRHDVELETDRWGMIPKWRPEFHTVAGMPLWSMEIYYRLLNCGFRLPASAGSASGVKAAPLGYNRVYVKVDDPFSYDDWFRALKAGRSFATNGPMLLLSAEGREPGDEVRAGGEGRTVRIRAEALTSRPLDRLEIVVNGRIVHAMSRPDAAGRWLAEMDQPFDHDGWIVARAFEPAGKTVRFAHTSPIYVTTGRPAPAAEDARFFVEWIDREIAFYRRSDGFRDPRHREEMVEFFGQAREVFAQLASGGAARVASSKKMPDGRTWTTSNLDIVVAGSHCYDDEELNCRRYGRLYTWESALKACRALGDGWRLPTDEEWRGLAKAFGGVHDDASDRGRAAYTALLAGGRSGFEAQLGGGRAPAGGDGYARVDAHGFYWTASERGPDAAWFYNFAKGSTGLYRQADGEKPRAFSVRCVRE